MSAPARTWKAELARLVVTALVAVAAAIPVTLLLLALNLASATIDRDPMRAHVAAGFADGALDPDPQRITWIPRGIDQWNDCVILMALVDEPGPALRQALSPQRLVKDSGPQNACDALQWMVSNKPVSLEPYHRYLHGPVTLAAPMMAMFSVAQARSLLGWAVTLAGVGLALASLWVLARAGRRGDRETAARAMFVGFAAVCLTLFSGQGLFAMSFTHFPVAMALYAYLAVALIVDFSRLSLGAHAALHAAFGAITAWIEFLTGAAPLGACLILYMADAQSPSSRPLPRALQALGAFGAGFLTAFVVKLAITYAVFGQAVIDDFGAGLGHRVAGASGGDIGEAAIGPLDAVKKLYWHAAYLGGGSEQLGRLLLIASGLGLAWSALLIFRRRLRGEALVRPVLLLGAALVIVAWHLIFFPHSFVHAWFMVRTLVGIILPAGALVLWLHRHDLARMAGSATGLARRP
jgi:hypothetical protein